MHQDSPILNYKSPNTNHQQRQLLPVLLTLLFALIALVALARFFAPVRVSRPEPEINATRVSLSNIKNALDAFQADNHRLPTTYEGLDSLVHPPPTLPTSHQYMDKLPTDAWGHPFLYRNPATAAPSTYDLHSLGTDATDNTVDDISVKDI